MLCLDRACGRKQEALSGNKSPVSLLIFEENRGIFFCELPPTIAQQIYWVSYGFGDLYKS